VAITVLTYVVLRVIIGVEPTRYTIAYMWTYNLDAWELSSAIFNHLLLLPMWGVIWLTRQRMPARSQHLLLILIPYAILWLLLASWRETRLVMPVALLLLPIAIFKDSTT
jgi:hypothetical protein